MRPREAPIGADRRSLHGQAIDRGVARARRARPRRVAAGLRRRRARLLARRDGTGRSRIDVHLDRVPLREDGMEPWEIMISESQERMVAAVRPGGAGGRRGGDRPLGAALGGDRRRHRDGAAASVPRRLSRGRDPRLVPHRRVPPLRGRARQAASRRLCNSDDPGVGCVGKVYEQYDEARWARGPSVSPGGSTRLVPSD